jgi:hypothetical protein
VQLEREVAPSSSESAESQTSGRDMPWSHDEDSRDQASDIGRRLGSAPDGLKGDCPKPRLETNFLVSLTPSDGAQGPTTPSTVNSGGGLDAALREGPWR